MVRTRDMIEIGRTGGVRLSILLSGLALLSVLLAAAGCAHQKAYKKGAKLSEEGRYEQAVEKLEEAVALAEQHNNEDAAQRYREKLEAVKQEAARFFCRQAEDCFARADLGAAQMLVERCIEYCPQEQPYRAFRRRIEEAIADAETMRGEALSLAEDRKWPESLARMREALDVYNTLPGGEGDLKRIQERAYHYHVARAQEYLQDNDLESAQAQAQAALSYRDAGREARSVLGTIKDRREAAALVARGRTSLAGGDYEEALRTLERAHELDPMYAELPELLSRARRAVCDRRLDQGRAALQAGQYPAALRLFRRSQELLHGYGGVDNLIATARSRLAEVHLTASQDSLDNGACGCAVLHAAAAVSYQPDNFEARRQLGQSAGQVRKEVSYTIEFAGFEAPPPQQNIANALGSAALEHLARVRPANVLLVEWTGGGEGAAATNTAADALLFGELLESRVMQETRQAGEGESIYQDGFRAEPNPEYVRAAAQVDAALAELERARHRLAEAEARLARYEHADPENAAEQARRRKAKADVAEARQRLVNAATDVGAAELSLAATPREVLVPNMVKHIYPIQTATWTANVSCMLKMQDAATGALILVERLEGTHVRSDHFVSADPARNVPEDPLEMPDDATLIGAATESLVTKLRRPLEAACKKHGHRFVVEMQRAEAAGYGVEAVDNAVKYLFAYPTGYEETDKMLGFLRGYLGQEAELIDIRKPLREHCQLRLN